jgi:hypothetical protein
MHRKNPMVHRVMPTPTSKVKSVFVWGFWNVYVYDLVMIIGHSLPKTMAVTIPEEEPFMTIVQVFFWALLLIVKDHYDSSSPRMQLNRTSLCRNSHRHQHSS